MLRLIGWTDKHPFMSAVLLAVCLVGFLIAAQIWATVEFTSQWSKYLTIILFIFFSLGYLLISVSTQHNRKVQLKLD